MDKGGCWFVCLFLGCLLPLPADVPDGVRACMLAAIHIDFIQTVAGVVSPVPPVVAAVGGSTFAATSAQVCTHCRHPDRQNFTK